MSADDAIDKIRKLALSSYLKARQADDLRQDIASSLKFHGGPFHPDDKVWYYQVDKKKIRGGQKKGSWIKATVVNSMHGAQWS